MARKKIRVKIDSEAHKRFLALMKNDKNISGAIRILFTRASQRQDLQLEYEIEFEVTGMMDYGLWDKLCRVFNQRMPFPG